MTEKFFQSIDYGAIPIVIGAPNIQVASSRVRQLHSRVVGRAQLMNLPDPRATFCICTQDFAPAPNSILHLKSKDEIPALIERVQYLMKNDTAYDEMHAYKRDGPTDNFLALIDLGITHPDCRLCIVLADRQRRHEREDKPKDRPCTCKDKGSGACTGCWDTTQGQELSLKCLWCGVFGEQIGSCTTCTFGSAANLSSSTYPAGRHSMNVILLMYHSFCTCRYCFSFTC